MRIPVDKILPLAGCIMLACVSVQAQPSDIRQGLVAYWPLDSTDGTVTPDLSPFGNSLNLIGMTSANFVPGVRGNAASFNGTSQLLSKIYTAGTDNGLPIYNARRYTIMLWVKGVGATQADRRVFSEGSTANNNPLLNIGTDSNSSATARTNIVDMFIRTDAGGTAGTPLSHVKSRGMAFDGNWHHIAWVEEDGAARLYIDGQLDATSFNYTRGTLTLNTISLGGIQRAATGSFFNGLIDDAALWERPLTEAEIQQVMNNGIETPIPELPPYFAQSPPPSITRNVGDRLTLTARAVGNRPLTYQWYKDGAEIPGATGTSLTLANMTPADSGTYVARASNFSGSTDATTVLTVNPDAAPDVRNGLLSFWPMDLLDQDDVSYSTPDLYSRNDMRLYTAGFFDQTPGAFGSGILFNGSDQYGRRIGGFPAYNNLTFSIAMWVQANGVGQSDRRFFAESSTNSDTPLFAFGTHATGVDGTMRVFIRNDANAALVAKNSTRTVLDGTWHHIVWTENNGFVRLYVDGVVDETDFSYTRSALTVNQTAVGAIVRAAVGSYFSGALDEVAVWSRVISFSEVQEIRNNGIPAPIGLIAPAITQQPQGQSVLTRSRVTFSFAASGTSPLDFHWRKDGNNIANETNATLVFPSVTLGDAGGYSVVVANSAGRATSDVATLTVTLRPPAPEGLSIDFNNTGQETDAQTEPGFSSFAIPAPGQGPFTRSFGGADLTIAGIGANLESRLRATPTANGAFTQERLLQDFIFARDSAADQGMDITVAFMEPNQLYSISIWSFDTGSAAPARISDWFANGVEVVHGYTFDNTVMPTSNDSYRLNFDATSDSSGTVVIQARRNASATASINIFLNAFSMQKAQFKLKGIRHSADGFDLVLTVEVLNAAATHQILQKGSLSDATWTEVPGVVWTFIGGRVFEASFVMPDVTQFYRVSETP